MGKELSSCELARASRRFAKKVLEKGKDKKKVCAQCRRVVNCRPCCWRLFFVFTPHPSPRALFLQCILVFDLTREFLEALIFVVLVADFTASPGQVNYDALAVGIFFTTITQNVLEITAIAVVAVIMGLHTLVIVIVAVTTAVAAATATNPVSKVSDQRQLR